MNARPQYVVEVGWAHDHPAWITLGHPIPDLDTAVAAMTGAALLGGRGVYGPDGTRRLRVRAVTR